MVCENHKPFFCKPSSTFKINYVNHISPICGLVKSEYELMLPSNVIMSLKVIFSTFDNLMISNVDNVF